MVDALSRTHEDLGVSVPTTSHAITCIRSPWVEEILNSYTNDAEVRELISQVLMTPKLVPQYTYIEGLLRHEDKIAVGKNNDVRAKILAAIHSSTVGGNFGVHSSYQRAKALFH